MLRFNVATIAKDISLNISAAAAKKSLISDADFILEGTGFQVLMHSLQLIGTCLLLLTNLTTLILHKSLPLLLSNTAH